MLHTNMPTKYDPSCEVMTGFKISRAPGSNGVTWFCPVWTCRKQVERSCLGDLGRWNWYAQIAMGIFVAGNIRSKPYIETSLKEVGWKQQPTKICSHDYIYIDRKMHSSKDFFSGRQQPVEDFSWNSRLCTSVNRWFTCQQSAGKRCERVWGLLSTHGGFLKWWYTKMDGL